MLVEKEVIAPGQYWYTDEKTGVPRKLDVTSDLTRYWHEQGQAMLSAGLAVPVPYEHDFSAHPMTPKEKLLNNAGEVREYRLKTFDDPKRGLVKDALFSVVEVQDPDAQRKVGRSIRWTSPWIASFTDGSGKKWDNVIAHLALTTRPRITKQEPFPSIAAALSMASTVKVTPSVPVAGDGFCLSRAGRIVVRKRDRAPRAMYPLAFSLMSGGVRLGANDDVRPLKKKGAADKPAADDEFSADPEGDEDGDKDFVPDDDPTNDATVDLPPLGDPAGDIGMEELLCDLLQALGVPMPDESDEANFKRHLYEATMSKIKELTSEGMGQAKKDKFEPDQNKPPNQQPNTAQPSNPIIKQEQQPMYMSLEEINKLPDPMRGVALAMHNENVRLRADLDASKKVSDGLRDAKLKEASAARATRVALLGRMSPRAKADLEAMMALPSMALSMGDGGAVVDPMEATIALLEKTVGDMPRLLTSDSAALAVAPHPADGEMTAERIDALADEMARKMGCAPVAKAS